MRILSPLGALAPLTLAALLGGTAVAQTATHSTAPVAQGASEPAPPAHPLSVVQAHALMRATGTDQIKTRLVAQVLSYFQQRFPPFIPQDVKDDLSTSLNKMDVDAPTVATYQRYISAEDADKIIAFYNTPAGRDLLKVEPVLLAHVQHDALEQAQQTVQTVMMRHKTEIEAAQKSYQAQHQPPAPTLGPGAPAAPPTPGKPQ